ncbi:MAG: iron ABC transporter permease [Eubacteriales bacterium]|nr:iron ABC transporter permease [Eubacteriales bacterium]
MKRPSKKLGLTMLILVPMLLVSLAVAMAVGSVSVPIIDTVKIVLKRLGLLFVNEQFTEGYERIIFFVRLPRVLLAAIVGASLSTAGAAMQGMFRNPMAEPGILGVSSGAGLGAVICIASGLNAYSLYFTPLFASVGALAAAFVIFALSVKDGKIPVMNLILSGLAVNMFLSAITTFILSFIHGDQVKQYMFWTVGSFNSARWESVGLIIVPVTICVTGLLFLSRELNVMLLGEEEAQSMGVNTLRTRVLLLIFTSIATAAAVSVSGTISFVGLIVPHIMRMIAGPDHKVLLPVSALSGSIFLVLCDLVGRVAAAPKEINVGIVTSLIGAPYLLYLLNRARRKGQVI